jgi:uncharacterized protein (DUF4415 family)
MHESRKNTFPDPYNGHPEWDNVDSLAFMHDPYIELPELTEERMAKGQWLVKGVPSTREESLAYLRANMQPEPVKTSVKLSKEVIDFFRDSGKGWQSRMDNALKEWINTHNTVKQ